jgi:hypothetical protein
VIGLLRRSAPPHWTNIGCHADRQSRGTLVPCTKEVVAIDCDGHRPVQPVRRQRDSLNPLGPDTSVPCDQSVPARRRSAPHLQKRLGWPFAFDMNVEARPARQPHASYGAGSPRTNARASRRPVNSPEYSARDGLRGARRLICIVSVAIRLSIRSSAALIESSIVPPYSNKCSTHKSHRHRRMNRPLPAHHGGSPGIWVGGHGSPPMLLFSDCGQSFYAAGR